MIITNQNSINPQEVETQQQRQEKKDVQRSSDRFASMLDSQKKQQQQFDKVADKANKEQASKARNNKAEVASSIGSKDAPGGVASSSARQVAGGNGPETPNVPPDIQKLAEEFGHQIQLHQLGNNSQMVDITFHSKTLPGLKVQIRRSKGQLAIRFLSQSVSTTQLLAKHTASLQETLESKGLNIASITLTGSRYPMNIPGSLSATV
ncbi:flagellar hook-length control protein FliK [Edaphobacter modestus]|uniref:Flagellar hook-length control protein FliK n=1 Tax=Edaphobacter modestus TaxID=388466 RepID=A0A4Q7YXQ0_9BACT|nr:flagellar hook-length control protein FliK [Edaphobacter modestus]RZU42234.1 flagellar hook-length control protein FliK [Edaphobacter modestus]